MIEHFVHTIEKDCVNNDLDIFTFDKPTEATVILTYSPDSHAEDVGGVLIDVKKTDTCMSAELSLYLLPEEALELSKILMKYAMTNARCKKPKSKKSKSKKR